MKGLLGAVLLALAALSAQALENELERLVESHQQKRHKMDAGELALVEEFGRRVAEGRYALKSYFRVTLDDATLGPIQEYTSQIKQLRLVSDADATIETLKTSMGAEAAEAALATEPQVRKLVESTLVRACEGYLWAMMPVFTEAALVGSRLAEQVEQRPRDRQVKDFLLGWAYYHTCRLLVMGDRAELLHRVPIRVDDARRLAVKIAAKLEARKQQQQQQQQRQ